MQSSVWVSLRGAAVAAVAGTVAGVAVVVAAGPAAAKGPERVAIALPGEEPVVLVAADGTREGPDPRVTRLVEDLGVWEAIAGGEPMLAEAPTGDLGPSMTVEWTFHGPAPAGADASPRLVQTVYPQAGGGALVYTAGGQRSYDQKTAPGWFRAPDRLVASLEAAGVEATIRKPASAAEAGDDPAPGVGDRARSAPEPNPAAQAAGPSGPAPASGVAAAAVGAMLVALLAIAVPRVVRQRRREAGAAPG